MPGIVRKNKKSPTCKTDFTQFRRNSTNNYICIYILNAFKVVVENKRHIKHFPHSLPFLFLLLRIENLKMLRKEYFLSNIRSLRNRTLRV